MRRLLIILLILAVAWPAWGDRDVSTLPATEDFEDADGDTSEYIDAVVQDGFYVLPTHQEGGGWDGGDCTRFDTSSSADRYHTLRFTNINETSLCVRALYKVPSSMTSHLASVQEPKIFIWQREAPYEAATYRVIQWWHYCNDTNVNYPMTITGKNNVQMDENNCSLEGTHSVSLTGPDYICSWEGNHELPDFTWGDWTDQWVSVEVCINITSGATPSTSMTVYLTTQDGTFDDDIILQPTCGVENIGTGTWDNIDVGMYGGGTPVSYFLLDDIVIDDSHIGPPAGFTGAVAAPSTISIPSGASISGGAMSLPGQ